MEWNNEGNNRGRKRKIEILREKERERG